MQNLMSLLIVLSLALITRQAYWPDHVMNPVSGEIFGHNPNVSKSNQLHVDIFRSLFTNLRNIP